MITIFHGDNLVQSRQKLVELLEQAKQKNIKIKRLRAKKLQPPELEAELVSNDLFGNERLVVIEELHSLPTSKRKKTLIELAAKSSTDLCLWEKRELTKTMLKKFPKAKVQLFKVANSLFNWLDSLSPQEKTKKQQLKLLKQTLVEEDEYTCFAMLCRQVRLLIQAKEGSQIKGPPFVINKIKRQAQQFSFHQLLDLHHQLHQLDQQLKTSSNILDLNKQLDLMILYL